MQQKYILQNDSEHIVSRNYKIHTARPDSDFYNLTCCSFIITQEEKKNFQKISKHAKTYLCTNLCDSGYRLIVGWTKRLHHLQWGKTTHTVRGTVVKCKTRTVSLACRGALSCGTSLRRK